MERAETGNFFPGQEELAVIISGVVVMGLEIVAGRFLAPEFGSTVYTWGSIIGVTMYALSLGYSHGGKRAEGKDSGDLYRLMVYTSFYIVLLIFKGDSLLGFAADLAGTSRYAAILPVTILFGPPTYLLGYISPYAVHLSSREGKAEAAGHFYAVGTAGSILGAFATTFLLVPYLQVESIYAFFAVLMLVLPLKNGESRLKAVTVLLMLLVLSLNSGTGNEIVYRDSTPYQELSIEDSEGVRYLILDDQQQSAIYLDGREGYPFDYPRYFHLVHLMREDVERVLFLGGGGFTAPERFADENITVDVVEIDPGVIRASKQYFNVSEGKYLNIYRGDARVFLSETGRDYDAIIVDTHRKGQIPFHLTTREFMKIAHRKTDENGVVFTNIISSARGKGSRFARAQYRTIDSVFNSAYYFPTSGYSEEIQTMEIVGSKGPRISEEELLRRNREYNVMNLSREIRNRVSSPPVEGAPVLTDDYAPVDKLVEPLIGRERVIE